VAFWQSRKAPWQYQQCILFRKFHGDDNIVAFGRNIAFQRVFPNRMNIDCALAFFKAYDGSCFQCLFALVIMIVKDIDY